MADVKQALVSILRGSTDLAAKVGSSSAARIYSKVLPPQSQWPGPSITVQRISDIPNHAMGSGSADQTGNGAGFNPVVRMQVRIWDLRDSEVEAVLAEVLEALDGFSGTAASFAIERIMHVNTVDGYDHDTRLHWSSLDFQVLT